MSHPVPARSDGGPHVAVDLVFAGQIAERLGFRDKRTISRTNGQIYAAWGLDSNGTDEKVARTRAAIIVTQRRLITWDGAGAAYVQSARGDWVAWVP